MLHSDMFIRIWKTSSSKNGFKTSHCQNPLILIQIYVNEVDYVKKKQIFVVLWWNLNVCSCLGCWLAYFSYPP